MAALAQYKRAFIDLMLECGVLTFGEFMTKSGRRTPYFINSGNFKDGYGISRLGELYAAALMAHLDGDFDNLYGPAYKGIPLASVTAAALYGQYGKNVSYTFNRKESKDHGERGMLVGHQYAGGEKVVIIEDVITAGTSVRESAGVLRAAGDVVLWALIVSVDRQEKGATDKSALEEVRAEFGLDAFAIVTLDEIVGYLQHRELDGKPVLDAETLGRIAAYRQLYGI